MLFHCVPSVDGKKWTLKEAPGLTLSFEFNEKGEVVSMTRHGGDESLLMPRRSNTPPEE